MSIEQRTRSRRSTRSGRRALSGRGGATARLRDSLFALLLATTGLGVVGAVGSVAAPAAGASTTPKTVTFSYTGSAQSWTVPSDVVGAVTFQVEGGGGGAGAAYSTIAGGAGGAGAKLTWSVTASAGTVFDVYVGSSGAAGQTTGVAGGTNGYSSGGGGAGGGVTSNTWTKSYEVGGGSGGAMSGVTSTSVCGSGPSDFCVIAGGGGGGGGAGYEYSHAGYAGGAGGYQDGAAGGGGYGAGGTPSGGLTSGGGGYPGVPSDGTYPAGAGGGGGGYSGGSGPSTDDGGNGAYGGGGGGSYADTSQGTLVSSGAGSNSEANGTVVIDYTLGVPPSFTTTSGSTAFTEGQSNSFTFTASGSPSPTFSESGSLPTGVSLSSSGVLSGTPTESGSFPITVVASNGVSPNATTSFTLEVGVPPSFASPPASATFTEGTALNLDFTASGTPTPTVSETGSLPAGVSLSSSGVLSGTPSQDGAYPITVIAQNGFSPEAMVSFTLDVDAPPSISEPSSSVTTSMGQAMTNVDFTSTGFPVPTFSEAGPLPTGVSLSSSGVLSGTPTVSGPYPITVTATNTVDKAPETSSTSFTLYVDAPPTVSGASTAHFSVGTDGTYQISSGGYPVPTLSLSATSSLPKGLSFSASSGSATISGTPASGTGGSYQVVVDATSSAGSSALPVDVAVDELPTFTSQSTIDLDAGTSVSFQVTTTGGFPVPSLTATASSLPSGLSFTDQSNGTAVLTGTATTAAEGTYHPVFTAKSSAGTVSQDATLHIQAPGAVISNCPAGSTCGGSRPVSPTITSASSATFLEGAAGSFQINASGSPGPSCTETGVLPSGVSLSTSCLLSGTPKAAGQFEFTVTAANEEPPNATQDFSLTVDAPLSVTASKGSESVEVGKAMTPVTFTATGFPSASLSTKSTLPAGVSFSKAGELSGTPSKTGTFSIVVTASDGVMPNATQDFTLMVTAPVTTAPVSSGGGGGSAPVSSGGGGYPTPAPAPPQLSGSSGTGPASTTTFSTGSGGSFQLPFSGAPTCAVVGGSLPPGLHLSSACLISGSPTKAGTYTFAVRATNAGGSIVQSFSLKVAPTKVVTVTPSGPDFKVVGSLWGALHMKMTSPVSLKGATEHTRGHKLESLVANFGFAMKGRIGRIHLILERDSHLVKRRQKVYGHMRTVRHRAYYYGGVLVLVDPHHHGALVFRHFSRVKLTHKMISGVAIGHLVVRRRVRRHVRRHGHVRLVWRTRAIHRPLRFGFRLSPSTS